MSQGNTPVSRRIADLSPERRAYLDRLLRDRHKAPALPALRARPLPAGVPLPCSFAQRRLWFLEQLEPGHPAYIILTAPRLSGAIDAGALDRSLQEVVRRHAILRTTFIEIDGEPRQVIADRGSVTLRTVDHRSADRTEAEAEVQRLASREAHQPFDLARGPLLRATLVHLAPDAHVLLLALHHIVTDGWSMGVLFQELTSAYDAYASGRAPLLPPLSIQYADFAAWQHESITGATIETHLAYWRQQLAALPELTLPTDRPRPAVKSARGAAVPWRLTAEAMARLEAASQREGVTLFMTMLAGFAVVLGRYSGQTDLAIGSPIANRTRAELEPLIGFFVNTLVMRVAFDDDPTFRTLMARVREVALGAYAHQDLPFERLVEALQPQRDLSRHPLFQVMFQLQTGVGPERAGSRADAVAVERTTSIFDLELNAWKTADGLEGWIDYSTELFDRETIVRLGAHFTTLLDAVLEQPDARLSSLPLLTLAERHEILHRWNETDRPVPAGTIVSLFEAQARRTPGAMAVRAERDEMTYDALNQRANRIAHVLRARGVGAESGSGRGAEAIETIVGVWLDRSVDLVAAIIGVLKAGAAYLPIDPETPAARVANLLADAGAAHVISRASVTGTIGSSSGSSDSIGPATGPTIGSAIGSAQLLDLDAEAAAIDAAPSDDPAVNISPESLAYVMYTSGSSGVPKGVEVTHRSVINLWSGLREAVYDRIESAARPLRVSLNGPVAFDTSVKQLVQLLSGHSLHVIPSDLRFDGPRLLDFLRRERIDVLDCPPAQLSLLIDAGLIDAGLLDGTSPMAILIGGEAIPTAMWHRLAACPHLRCVNLYGPTECTVDAVLCTVAGGTPIIGRPIANVDAYVLDPQRQPVPIGVPGQLYIGGLGLARGYRGRSDLTRERFVPHPFRDPPARLYRTGDRVRYRADGQIEFLGRLDDQVKVRGFRVEPGEIAAALIAHPAVAEAWVIVREDTPGSPRLVAYLVAVPTSTGGRGDAEEPVTPDALGRFLRATLPDYMIPAAYVWLPAIPLTSRGKRDRAALPVPGRARPAVERPFVSPNSPNERAVAAIWEQLLEVDHIGIYDDFFAELGGHSLVATRMVSRVRNAFGVELPLRWVFERPTVAGIVAAIEGAKAAVTPGPPLTRAPRDRYRARRRADGSLELPAALMPHRGDQV